MADGVVKAFLVPTGPAGPGVPVGGVAGQTISKVSGSDYDTTWTDLRVNRASMSGDETLVDTDADYLTRDPNGNDRVITLPTTSRTIGRVIKHIGGANTITVQDPTPTTLVVLNAGDSKSFLFDGTAWVML